MRNMLIVGSLVFLFSFNYFMIDNHLEERLKDTNLSSGNITYHIDDTIFQVVSTEPGTYLVPKGSILGKDDVDHISYTYTIELDNESILDEQSIDIVLVFGNAPTETINDLFDTEYIVSINEDSTEAIITTNIYLKEIQTKEDYELLTNQELQLSMEIYMN